MPDPQGLEATGIALGTLAITLLARTKAFRDQMAKALNALKKFNAEASKQKAAFAGMAKAVSASVRETTSAVTAGTKQTQSAMSAVSKQYKTSSDQAQASGRKTRTSVQQTASTMDKAGKQMISRGKQQLGAIISFQEGVAKFIKLNVRWFVVWRSFWFLWSKLQDALENINVLMHETSLALRTGADALSNEVELLVKRNALTREAIRFTAQHTKSLRDYIKSFYYLTTAGLAWNVAQETIDTTMETAIALDEDAIQTTRTLTSLYNVFGKTLTTARTPVAKMQKISAILTATFRQQDIEMADYNKAMTYVGALSKTAGVSLEVLVASLGVLGTHFVKSSKGGTALARTFARLLRYPERLAKVTGFAFDPSRPLQFEQAVRLIGQELRKSSSDTDEFAVSTQKAAEMIDLLGLRGIRVITLAENFEKLAEQIRINREATYDLVESMVALVESDPSAQLKILGNAVSMNITAMVRGAIQTQTFSGQLASLNKVLLRAIDLSEDLGRAVGMLLGSIEKIPVALIAWRLSSGKAIAPTSALGKWVDRLGLSLLLVGRAFTRTKVNQRVIGLGAAMKGIVGNFTKFVPAIGRVLGRLGKFAGWFGIAIGAMGAFGVAWDAITGKFTKKSMQFAFEEVAIQKGLLSKIASFLSLRNLSYRIANYKLMKMWEKRRDAYAKELDKEELTETEHAQRMQEYMIRTWSIWLGVEETQLRKRMGLITEADEELMGERVRIEGETLQELRKLQQSGLENQLYALDQRIMVMKAKEADASLIETYFTTKREAIFSKALKGLSEKYRKAWDAMRQTQKTSLDRQLEDSRAAGSELEKIYALNLLIRARMQYEAGTAEADIISDAMKALENETLEGMNAIEMARIQARHYGLDDLYELLQESADKEKLLQVNKGIALLQIEKKALKELTGLLKEQTNFRHGKLIAGGKKDLVALKQNYEKRKTAAAEEVAEITESREASQSAQTAATKAHQKALTKLTVQNEIERSEIEAHWAKKRADLRAKNTVENYRQTVTAWQNIAKRIGDIHRKHLDNIEKQRAVSTEKEITDADERKKVLEKLDEDEVVSTIWRDVALYKARFKEAEAYFKYLLRVKQHVVKALTEDDQEMADSSSRAWISIMAGMTGASEDYLKRIGTFSDMVKRIFSRLYQDLENVISSSLQKMIGLEDEYSRESLELIAERNEERKQRLRDDLEEGKINRERYYLELDEMDRKFTEEVENRRRGFTKNMGELWKSLQRTALAEFSKLIVGIIAESMKKLAVEKGITKAVVSEQTAQGVSKLWNWFTGLGPIGMVIGAGVVAGFIAKMTGLVKFAKGGVVKKRTAALIGEEGPEAVIPLERRKGKLGVSERGREILQPLLGLFAKGGIIKKKTAALIGEEGPEAVIPLTRKAGRLGISERGREILQPLLGLEETIPSLLRSAAQTEGLIRLSPEATAALGARSRPASMKTEQKVDISVTFEGDTIDFTGSVPMINDITTIDKVYEDIWLPAKRRRIERLKETIAEVIE